MMLTSASITNTVAGENLFRYNKIIHQTLIIFALFMSIPAYADNGSRFLGRWIGIDPNDGGFQQMTFTDRDGDGEIDIILRDTLLTLCNSSDRGVLTGEGIDIDRRAGVLTFDLTLECFVPPFDVVVLSDATCVHNRMEDTLQCVFTPVLPIPTTFHRN